MRSRVRSDDDVLADDSPRDRRFLPYLGLNCPSKDKFPRLRVTLSRSFILWT